MELKSRRMRMVEICKSKNNNENHIVSTPILEVTPNKIMETKMKPLNKLRNSSPQNTKRSFEVSAPLSDITPYGISNIIFEPDEELMQAIIKNYDASSCSLLNISLLESDNIYGNITELEKQANLDNVRNLPVLSSDVPENEDNIIYTELKAASELNLEMCPNVYFPSDIFTTNDIQNNDQVELEQPLKTPDPDVGNPVRRGGVFSVLQSKNRTDNDNDNGQEEEKHDSDSDIQGFLEDPDFIPENKRSDSEEENSNENTQGRPKQGRKRK